jgi:hypothetical protein
MGKIVVMRHCPAAPTLSFPWTRLGSTLVSEAHQDLVRQFRYQVSLLEGVDGSKCTPCSAHNIYVYEAGLAPMTCFSDVSAD